MADGQVQQHAFWQSPAVRTVDKPEMDFADTVARTRELLRESVKMQLMSDVPLGAFLSGGLDSAIITHNAVALSDLDVPLYCAGTDDESLNEFAFAREMAERLGCELHEERILASNYATHWVTLIRNKGLPLSTPNEISIYRLAQALKTRCTVTLTGEGADEIFGGYVQPHFGAYDFDRSAREPEAVDETSALSWALRMRYGRGFFLNDTDHYLATCCWVPYAVKQTILRPEVWTALAQDEAVFCFYEDFFDSLEGCSTFDKRMHLHLRYNLENLLFRVDSSTMAASVEARVPFTDHRLVELAFTTPDSFKMDWVDESARQRGRQLPVEGIDAAGLLETKRLPRRAFQDQLPSSIVSRRKMSFPVPIGDWFSGPLAAMVGERCNTSTLYHEHFRPGTVEKMIQERDRSLWLVANLCLWWDEINALV